jgi:RiboL-PSP-HEPN
MTPSPSAVSYFTAIEKTGILRRVANDNRLRPIPKDHKQAYYHAALAVSVAAWDAYIKNLVLNFYTEVTDILIAKYHALHTVTSNLAGVALSRFNTPNAENSRNLLIQYTGYDPIGDWIWPAARMNGQQVRDRLNEILKVRHSFAHGFGLPAYSWTRSRSGHIRLTNEAIQNTEAFLNNLVTRTDRGMQEHINTQYGATVLWYT